jgi:hypothetical protein
MPEAAPRNELELIDLGEWGRIFEPEQLVQIHESSLHQPDGRFETEWLAEANPAALADPRTLARSSRLPPIHRS